MNNSFKRYIEEDDDEEHDNEMEYEDFLDEDALDEGLALPVSLSDLNYDEKLELYKYKQNHNEIDWEREIMRRTDLQSRRIDLERLRKMASNNHMINKTNDSNMNMSNNVNKKGGSNNKSNQITGKKRIINDDYDEEEQEEVEDDDDEVEEDEDEGADFAKDNDDDDDDDFANVVEDEDRDDDDEEDDDDDSNLFDSDEEEEITKRVQQSSATRELDNGSKVLGKGTKRKQPASASTRVRRSTRSRTSKKKNDIFDDDDDDDDDFNDLDGDDKEEGEIYGRRGEYLDGDINITAIKDQIKRVKSGRAKKNNNQMIDSDLVIDKNKIDENNEHDLDLYDDSPEASLIDYQRIQTRRDMIFKWMHEPYLKQAIIGSFVRLSVGDNNGKPIYRMCEVIDLDTDSKTYYTQVAGVPVGKPLTLRATLSFAGYIKKMARLDLVSNSRLTQEELDYYAQCLRSNHKLSDHKLLTTNQIERRRRKIAKAFGEHIYTRN